MKTIEQIKELIIKHEAAVSYLKTQYVPFVKTLQIDHPYDERFDYNVVEIFKNLTPVELNKEDENIRDNIVELIEKLNSSIEEKANRAVQNNQDIDKKIQDLEEAFKKELSDVAEINLSSKMVLTFKNVEKADREHFVNAYKNCGITHYTLGNEKHHLYYNPDIIHFNTLKDDIFRSLPLNIQKKYPGFVAKIQNHRLNTKPESNSDLFTVIMVRNNLQSL